MQKKKKKLKTDPDMQWKTALSVLFQELAILANSFNKVITDVRREEHHKK